ncbi:ligase-associated DNA damage response DEXH box helicase [Pollutibacter soli]|uniref:ligase-associated DNA damage response DEXH box helicase n=1 Tax=Pollutibacter soli TaxID=3034157 RepID=UPI0030140D17
MHGRTDQFTDTTGFLHIKQWLHAKQMFPFAFQQETWEHIHLAKSGLVNAPTGCGKTFSVFLGNVIRYINAYPDSWKQKRKNGLQLIWITPLRALAKDIGRAMETALAEINLPWQVGIRNGDTDTAERQRQKRNMPEVLIITPESLHLLLAQKDYSNVFSSLQCIAVDEWHELLGSKRGVQVELAISRIAGLRKKSIVHAEKQGIDLPGKIMIWGISATIGNLIEARDVLLTPVIKNFGEGNTVIVKAEIKKNIVIESIYPDEIEHYPWAGHLGIKLAHKLLPIIESSRTTLIFINTRGMSERWYQVLLDIKPELAGAIAIHHGSIEQALRLWVEDALHEGVLKAVVCTASLDLGVDFRPVETVVQVGSPKGVGRFLQRAGRSGHQPGETSRIYFLPTHSLELMEAAALKTAMEENEIESRVPMMLCFDVLIQYLCTLAIAEGFRPEDILPEIRTTHCYSDVTDEEWLQILQFITIGGKALQQYDEFKKVEIEDGVYRIRNRRVAMRHRLHIGTIVSEAMMKVKFMSGGFIGVIEEWFISRLNPGDVFTLSGRNLEFIMIKDMTAVVKKSNSKKSIVPSWQGGRMPLSANLGRILRRKFDEAADRSREEEIRKLQPLLDLQQELSYVPRQNELLIEHIETRDGFHLFVHTFEGRLVNEAMAALLAFRISRIMPITFSLAMNDYSFELLSDQPIPVDDSNVYELFSSDNLIEDIQRSANATEMAKRKFRDIAVIGGLIFQGFPGEQKKARHLQSSASLLFQVFHDYDSHNLLMRQAYQEVFDQQMEETRLRDMLTRIQQSKIILSFPERLTPFSFPVKVDSLRENLSSEKLEDRVKRMQTQLGK